MKTLTNSQTTLTKKLSAAYALTNIPLYLIDEEYRLIYHTTTINISSDTFSQVAQYCIQHLHTTSESALYIPKIQIPFSNVYYGIIPIPNQQYILVGPVANQELHYSPFKNYLQKKYTLELTNLLFQLFQNTPTLNLYRFQTIVFSFAYTLCQKVQHTKEPCCHSKLLQKCISYIQENLYKKITLEELSSSVNASIRTIQRHFREQLNTSPIDYITEQKLKEACNLLENSSYTVVEIANILSYSSQSHFTKTFKTHYQVTPNQYRQTRQASTDYQ